MKSPTGSLQIRQHLRHILRAVLCAVLAAVILLPAAAFADSGRKTVRVGWYETPFNITDSLGRRSGYAYEYQRKIAVYTGWDYEYVEGSWPDLLEMLKNGEIDLMSDVSYKEDRLEHMLYSALPMGTEIYYLYIAPDNDAINADDYSTLNGKRVGITVGSYQEDLFMAWQKSHGVEKVEDVVKVGDELEVKVCEIDAQGRINLIRNDITYDNPNFTRSAPAVSRPPRRDGRK